MPNNKQYKQYKGRIKDTTTSEPIAEAKVVLDLKGIPKHTITDATGLFCFEINYAHTGVSMITLEANGYKRYTQKIFEISDDISEFRLEPKAVEAEAVEAVEAVEGQSFWNRLPLPIKVATITAFATITAAFISGIIPNIYPVPSNDANDASVAIPPVPITPNPHQLDIKTQIIEQIKTDGNYKKALEILNGQSMEGMLLILQSLVKNNYLNQLYEKNKSIKYPVDRRRIGVAMETVLYTERSSFDFSLDSISWLKEQCPTETHDQVSHIADFIGANSSDSKKQTPSFSKLKKVWQCS